MSRQRKPLPLSLVASALVPLGLLGTVGLVGLVGTADGQPELSVNAPDPRGWSNGVPAADVERALQANEAVTVDLPLTVVEKVQGRTVLFYFSPTCPHCQNVMGEVNDLVVRAPDLPWIGVASGLSTEAQLNEFRGTYGGDFPMVIDTDRTFAAAVSARSTPSVYVVRPWVEGDPVEEGAPDVGMRRMVVDEAYLPFGRGLGNILLMRHAVGNPFQYFSGGYQGDQTCGVCHGNERMSMAITHHYAAFWTLYQRERHTDEACVGCHVTGLPVPGKTVAGADESGKTPGGGYVLGDLGHPMAGVQCEACHGPGGPHDGRPTDAKTSCTGCHDAEHSVAFSLEKGMPHIDHYKAGHLTEEELQARVDALREGTAERPLLAFPDGPTVGADQCKSCHRSDHKAWKKAAHAQAMDRLTASGDANRVECVRCHASPKAVGLGAAKENLEDYRREEGVGCEACHGPGAAHVAAPSKSNIVGLGESCPECVIEAICTNCHDQTWDPHWDLKVRLAGSKHQK